MPKITVAALLTAVACALPAQAVAQTEPITPAVVATSLTIADQWAATAAPQLPNHCSGGRLKITWVDSARVAGWANGWAAQPDGTNVWDHTKCDVTIAKGMSPAQTCWIITHELMHFVWGPEHTGPLDPPSDQPHSAGAEKCLVAFEPAEVEDNTKPPCHNPKMPCWIWVHEGDGTRKIMLKGAKRSIKVGYYSFGRYASQKRINWKRTKRMKGDATARLLYTETVKDR